MEQEKAPEESTENSSFSKLLMFGTVKFLTGSYHFLSALSSNPDPLFSIIISFYCLILLYLPHLFLSFLFSPVLLSTAVLLATLLRLGSAQQEKDETSVTEIEEPDPKRDGTNWVQSETCQGLAQQESASIFAPDVDEEDSEDGVTNWIGAEKGAEAEMGFAGNAGFYETFLEWNRSGPLEVIYEEYEGEEHEDSPEMESRHAGFDSLLFPDSDYSDSDSDSSKGESPNGFPPSWDSPENLCFVWEEMEGLIEIPLGLKRTVGFEVEEENLIEINLLVAGK